MSRFARRLHQMDRMPEAVQALECFARTENPLPVSHLLMQWHEELKQTKEAERWLEYGVKRAEPEAILLAAK